MPIGQTAGREQGAARPAVRSRGFYRFLQPETAMRVAVSAARGQLGHICARAQDPRGGIMLTRHGRDITAMQDDDWFGRKNPLTGRRPPNRRLGIVIALF